MQHSTPLAAFLLALTIYAGGCVGEAYENVDTTLDGDEDGAGDHGDSDDTEDTDATPGDPGNPTDPNPPTDDDPPPYTPPTCAEGTDFALPNNAPALTQGQFVEISPPGVPFNGDPLAITQGMTIDPCNPATIYVCVVDAEGGLYRSTDAGATWIVLGNFQTPINVRVDPEDPLHLYVVDGVRGSTNGFHVSHDGGQTWEITQGFIDFVEDDGGVYDAYHVEPDPTNFDHVLVTFHSPWKDVGKSGVIESFDGGETFEKKALVNGAAADGNAVYFLYEPSLGIGNSNTWMFATQGSGHYRTTDGGDTWTLATATKMQHGGGTIYYTREGVLYMSSAEGVLKSTDNGVSFERVGPSRPYLSVIGDGTRLYTGQHFNTRFFTALESNDTEWSDFNTQDFAEGPFQMAIDTHNGILYSANIRAGVWALKL